MCEITTKKCTKCGEVKALDAFNKHKAGKYGKQSQCKCCFNKYYQENKQRINDSQREYRSGNRDVVRKYNAKYYQNNKQRCADNVRKYRQENPEVYLRVNRKRRALKRNLPHQPLTPQQYEILHRQKYQIFGGIASGN